MAQGQGQGQGNQGQGQGRGQARGNQREVVPPEGRASAGTVPLNVPNELARTVLRPVEFTDRPSRKG